MNYCQIILIQTFMGRNIFLYGFTIVKKNLYYWDYHGYLKALNSVR